MWTVTKGLREEKCIRPDNYTSAVVKISFFSPRNVGFFNSKLGRARTEQLIDCGLSCGIVFPFLAHVLPEFHQSLIHEHFESNIHSHQIVLMRTLVTMGISVSIWIFSGYKEFFNFSLIESCSRSNSAAFHCVSFSSKTESEVSSTSLLTSYTSVYVSNNNFVQFLLGACSTTVLEYTM